MHERSLARSILAQVAQIAVAEGGGLVREVRVQCGPLSGVEPELLASAFDALRAEAEMPITALFIENVPLAAVCKTCNNHFEPERFRFRCPHCGSEKAEVVAGEGVILESIVLEPVGQAFQPDELDQFSTVSKNSRAGKLDLP